jgi:hypothetical protein
MTKRIYLSTIAVFIGVLVFGQPDSAAVRSLTFSEAFGVALMNSPALQQANQNTLQKKQELKAARGLYAPKINIGAAYTVMSEDITMDLNPLKNPLPSSIIHWAIMVISPVFQIPTQTLINKCPSYPMMFQLRPFAAGY